MSGEDDDWLTWFLTEILAPLGFAVAVVLTLALAILVIADMITR